jgi:hypothetical protein
MTARRRPRSDSIRRAHQAFLANVAGRREDYFWLRDEQHLTPEQAAERLGITTRTAARYEAWRRAAEGLPPARDPNVIAERKRVVRELHAQGLSDSRIAARLGMTRSGVYCIRRSLGLKANWDPNAPRKAVAA